jgi:hypothetical protein
MREETIKLYKFPELSDEAKEKAIEKYREDLWTHGDDNMQFFYRDLRNDLKTPLEYFTSFSDDYICKRNLGLVQELATAIQSIELIELDTYRRYCKIKLNLDWQVVTEYNIKLHYPREANRLLALLKDSRIDLRTCGLAYCGKSYKENFLDKICKNLNTYLAETEVDVKTDIEYFLLRSAEESEKYYSSDEFITEELTQLEFEFTEDGERY